MRYLDTFSGIGSASVAWKPLGWEAVAYAENAAFPAAVLKHRFPETQNLGDCNGFKKWPDLGPVDLVSGGTPCQSFSIAGLRAGLADPRGQLTLTFLAVVDRYRPRWVVWENTLGVLNDDDGRSFASILGALAILGYGWSYRVLDAEYVRVDSHPRAVPQRRRRVFLVGYLGDWRRAAAVFFEPKGLLGNSPPRRSSGKGVASDVAPGLVRSGRGVQRTGESRGQDPLVATEVSGTVSSKWHKGTGGPAGDEAYNLVAHTLTAEGFDASEDGTGRGPPLIVDSVLPFDTTQITSPGNYSNPQDGDPAHALAATAHPPAIAFSSKDRGEDVYDEVAPTMRAMNNANSHANAGGQVAVAFAIQERAVSENLDTIADGRARVGPDGKGWSDDGAAYTLEARSTTQAVAFQPRVARNDRGDAQEVAHSLTAEPGSTGKGDSAECVAIDLRNGAVDGDVTMSLQAGGMGDERGRSINSIPHVGVSDAMVSVHKFARSRWAVRRLMPVECERLMGLPDGWTDVPWRGKEHTPDGPRYKALGNAWAINQARWIGERITLVDRVFDEADRSRKVG